MHSILFFCAFFLMTPSLADVSPVDVELFQDLLDMFTRKDTLFDGHYNVAGENLWVQFYHDVTLHRDQSLISWVNSTWKEVVLVLNIPLTRIGRDSTPNFEDWTDCTVVVSFLVSFPTVDVIDMPEIKVDYKSCQNTRVSGLFEPLSKELTKQAMSSWSQLVENAQGFRFKLMQRWLDKFLYWA